MKKQAPTLIAGLMIGALLAGGTAIAVTSTSFTYASVKTGYLAVSPMDFAPDHLLGATSDYLNTWDGAVLTNQDGNRCFNAGVNLPNGARIKSVRFFYTSDASSDFYGTLMRVNPLTGATGRIAEVIPADDTNTRTSASDSIAATKQTVSNKVWQYSMGACPFSGTAFHGARITYTYKTAGD